jgi:7-cyano-7-deazaguanine tRNA-ribosyltransferase
MFELRDRDGLARIGRLQTEHGILETPALLPVVHPDPRRGPIRPSELAREWGVNALITSSYILSRSPEVRRECEEKGIHRALDFPGIIMTDSGAFQQHAFGRVEVSPREILELQNRIGSDIATVLDDFVEPDADRTRARAGAQITETRIQEARRLRPQGLLAAPVQGGRYEDLRREAARSASSLGDIVAVGGIVPLFEKYRFASLARILRAVRQGLAPEHPVHLFGLGHPMVFAWGALFGGDLFDSALYSKFAQRGALVFPEGTLPLESVREDFCPCRLCERTPLTAISTLPAPERETHIARHNLLQSLAEVRRVRQAIREGTLWELAERRALGHPALREGLRETLADVGIFLEAEPWSRRTLRLQLPESWGRPAIVRWRQRLEEYRASFSLRRSWPGGSLDPAKLARGPPPELPGSGEVLWEVPTPLGPVPVELSQVYPGGSLLAPDDDFGVEEEGSDREDPASHARMEEIPGPDPERLAAWTRRHVRGLLRWCWGTHAMALAEAPDLKVRRTRSSGRLRDIARGPEVLFHVGNDGLPRPTLRGGQELWSRLPKPRGRVVASEEAVPFVLAGQSLFSRHVRTADPNLHPGDPVLLVDQADLYLGVGQGILSGPEMGRFLRGVAVRVTAHIPPP